MSRHALTQLVIGIALFGVGLAAYPFFRSLSPTQDAIYKWQSEFDVSAQRPGHLV